MHQREKRGYTGTAMRWLFRGALIVILAQQVSGCSSNLRRRLEDVDKHETDEHVGDGSILGRNAPIASRTRIVSSKTGTVHSSDDVFISCEFSSLWTKERHPDDYPSNAHFSPLVFASHSEKYQMWANGALASPGVKEVAEVSQKI